MRKAGWVFWLLWAAVLLFGAMGVANRFISGHRLAGYTSYVPWGMWVAAYIYFIGLSAGAFLLSSLVYVFGVKALERIAKLALFTAISTLFMALLSIWFDLGHMWRFYEVFTRPQFHSMMAWMVWLYTAYFLLLLAETYFAIRPDLYARRSRPGLSGWLARTLGYRQAPEPDQLARDRQTLKVLGTIGVPLAIAFHGGVGALFGTVVARGYWHSPIFPILFLTGALVSGGGLLAFLVAAIWPQRHEAWRQLVQLLGRITLGLVLFDLLLEWAEYSIPMWYGVGSEYVLLKAVLFGSHWYVYWIIHILLGVAVPVLLLWLRPQRPWAVGLAGSLVALSFFAVRLNLVIPGLVTPQLKGLETAYLSDRLSYAYTPTLFEWQVTAFIVALGVALLYLGYRLLPLVTESRESKEAA